MHLARIAAFAALAAALLACTRSAPGPRPPARISLSDPDARARIERAVALAEGWLLANFLESGEFVYLYDPIADERPRHNNMARQFLTARTLLEMARERPELAAMHQENADAMLRLYYREDQRGLGYMWRIDRSKLGPNALAVRVLVASPLFATRYREPARRLADGMVALLRADGSFEPWFKPPPEKRTSDARLLAFYSGQAILALLEYAERAGEPAYREAALRAQEFYLGHYVVRMDENYFPAYVPWHTQSLVRLFGETRDMRYADAVFRLNDKLLEIQEREGYVGRFYDRDHPEWGGPNSSSDAVYIESLALAMHLAATLDDGAHVARYGEALDLALGNLLSLQYTGPVAGYPGDVRGYVGGMRTNAHRPNVRVDNTSHSVDALRAVLAALAVLDQLDGARRALDRARPRGHGVTMVGAGDRVAPGAE